MNSLMFPPPAFLVLVLKMKKKKIMCAHALLGAPHQEVNVTLSYWHFDLSFSDLVTIMKPHLHLNHQAFLQSTSLCHYSFVSCTQCCPERLGFTRFTLSMCITLRIKMPSLMLTQIKRLIVQMAEDKQTAKHASHCALTTRQRTWEEMDWPWEHLLFQLPHFLSLCASFKHTQACCLVINLLLFPITYMIWVEKWVRTLKTKYFHIHYDKIIYIMIILW